MKTPTKLLFCVILIFVTNGNAMALTSFDSVYRYKLEMSKDDKVCRHMEKVYKEKFRSPWMYRADVWSDPDRAKKVFTRLPSVEFNADLAQLMSQAKFPSSPEFEAINWREGRYKSTVSSKEVTLPVLVADFDIDNDGTLDTVLHGTFYTPKHPSHDAFSIYPEGALDLMVFEDSWLPPSTDAQIQKTRTLYRSVETLTDETWNSLRPFILDGVTYLSATGYEPPRNSFFKHGQTFKDHKALSKYIEKTRAKFPRYMAVMKYIKGSRDREGRDQPPLEFETICRFRMTEVHQPSKGE